MTQSASDFHIRQLTEADAEIYYPVRLRALRDEPDAFGASYEEALARPLSATAERLRAQVASGESFTLGAFDGDGEGDPLVGMVTFTRESPAKFRHRGDITAMYVAPEARGRGIGRALLTEALARVRAILGVEQVHLAVVSGNAPARALYASLGFTKFGVARRSFRLGNAYLDEDFMVLYLAE
jgi:ribosomal protein S18 acetylase RimI-like enzyme